MKNQLGKIATWTQQNNRNELQTQALTCLNVAHDAIRVFDETVGGKSAEAGRVRRRRVKIEGAYLGAKVAKPLVNRLTIGIDDVTAQARSTDIPKWDDTTDFTSAFSFVVADASSGAGPGSLFNDVFATHKKKIERKVTNLVAKMTKLAGMTRLHLADNEPFKLDAAKFPRWCADDQPILVAMSPMTLALDANFYRWPGLGAS